MTDWKGFWSYVHADDIADGGRITRLTQDVSSQFEMLTGESIELFVDKASLDWGDNWRKKIDESLSKVAFIIPIITPRFFMSSECRRELQSFIRQATNRGFTELILPLLYVDFPGFHDDTTKDDLIKIVRDYQWVDWCDLRFRTTDSEEYRRGVSNIAKRLVDANKHVEEVASEVPYQPEVNVNSYDDEAPGTIDLLAKSEDMLGKSPEILSAVTFNIAEMTQVLQDAAIEMQQGNDQGSGFSARLYSARRAAKRLSDPIEKIWALSNEYASITHDVDIGVRIIIDRAKIEVREDPSSIFKFCTFFESIRYLSNKSDSAIDSLKKLMEASDPLENLSRDLRPVVRKLKSGLTIFIESAGVSNEWVKLIEASGIQCEPATEFTSPN